MHSLSVPLATHHVLVPSTTLLVLFIIALPRWAGYIDDLEEVITTHREALTYCPFGHPSHSGCLNNLALALYSHFNQLGKMEDLEDAITSHHEALALYTQGHPDRSMSLSNLAIALVTRFNQLGRIEDLEDAITSHHEALTLCPLGHPDHSKNPSTILVLIFVCALSSWAR